MTFYIIGSGRVGSGRVGSGGHLKASELRALLVPFHSIFTGLRTLCFYHFNAPMISWYPVYRHFGPVTRTRSRCGICRSVSVYGNLWF